MDNELEQFERALTGVYDNLTGPGSPPMERAERDAVHHAVVAASMIGCAILRIAAALEAHKPTRPSDDAHN